jgi:hypothetical protein
MTGTPPPEAAYEALAAVLEAHTILVGPVSDRDCRCSCGWSEPIADPALSVKYRRHVALYRADAVWPLAVATVLRQITDAEQLRERLRLARIHDLQLRKELTAAYGALECANARIAEGTEEE